MTVDRGHWSCTRHHGSCNHGAGEGGHVAACVKPMRNTGDEGGATATTGDNGGAFRLGRVLIPDVTMVVAFS